MARGRTDRWSGEEIPKEVVDRPSPSGLLQMTARVGPDPSWVRRLARSEGLTVRMRACQPILPGGRRSVHLLELGGPAEVVERALAALPADPEVVRVTEAPHIPSDPAIVRVEATTNARCRILFTAGLLCRSCRFLEAPEAQPAPWEVVGPHPTVNRAERRAREKALTRDGAVLRSLRPWTARPGLTPRQRTALGVARRLGYFGVPRRADLAAVAKELGVSRSSAAELLHRGVSRILAEAFDSAPPLHS
ncbi:MAG: helix-turn-helix domain-containing protein [Thermoplasmata archaeon]